MCGICGIIDVTRSGQHDPALVRAMTACIAHRGPDGDGFYDAPHVSLGMRRLSIIDVAGSDQPLYNEDRSIAMVFNGEIYNYRELQSDLRAAGHTLRTDGDGETLIHLYEQHGLDFFRHLRGMYGFAMWDARNERLILAVDHIGMKPLYVHERGGKLYFASETKALFATREIMPELNLPVLDTYLSFGYPVGQETLFSGIERLMPGHALIVEKGSITRHRYWLFSEDYSATISRTAPRPADQTLFVPGTAGKEPADTFDLVERVRQKLRESVMLHLRSDVPLGLFLSGGIDSAAMLALMAELVDLKIQTYTVGFSGASPDNELLHARRIAGHFQTNHHERIISPQDWWHGLEHYAYHHDEPNANPSAVSMMLLAEDTAKQVKVVLTGLGGDELFGGYMHHRAIPALIQRQHDWEGVPGKSVIENTLRWLEQFYPTFKRYRLVGALPTYLPRFRQAMLPREAELMRMHSYDGMVFSDALRDSLYGDDLKTAWKTAQHKEKTYRSIMERSWHADPVRTAQALIINTWLTGNALLSQDKVTMAHSLEARVPFFDPALFALAARIPTPLLVRGNKYMLREAMRPYLPDFALNRPKQPFSTPIRGWFESALKPQIQAVLFDSSAVSAQLFNRPALEHLLNAHFSGQQKQEEVIFRLLNLELWHRAFFREKRATMTAGV